MQAINAKSKSDPIRVEQQPMKREKSRTWEGIESAEEVLQYENEKDRESKSLLNFVQYMNDQEAVQANQPKIDQSP